MDQLNGKKGDFPVGPLSVGEVSMATGPPVKGRPGTKRAPLAHVHDQTWRPISAPRVKRCSSHSIEDWQVAAERTAKCGQPASHRA